MGNPEMDNKKVAKAKNLLRLKLEESSVLRNASIVRQPELDLIEYVAFAVLPELTGQAGMISYLIKDKEILSSGQPNHLDRIMSQLMKANKTLDIEHFANLFFKMKVLHNGVVLYKKNGNALLEANNLEIKNFIEPSVKKQYNGLNYRFLFFDTSNFTVSFWDIQVQNNGKTRYSVNLSDPETKLP